MHRNHCFTAGSIAGHITTFVAGIAAILKSTLMKDFTGELPTISLTRISEEEIPDDTVNQ